MLSMQLKECTHFIIRTLQSTTISALCVSTGAAIYSTRYVLYTYVPNTSTPSTKNIVCGNVTALIKMRCILLHIVLE